MSTDTHKTYTPKHIQITHTFTNDLKFFLQALKKKPVVYSNLAYTKGFLKPLPTIPNSLVFNFATSAQRKTKTLWYRGYWADGRSLVESTARMKRNKVRKLMFVPDSASVLSTGFQLCFRDCFKVGNHFLLTRVCITNSYKVNRKSGRTVIYHLL